jgi:hypothetical protein
VVLHQQDFVRASYPLLQEDSHHYRSAHIFKVQITTHPGHHAHGKKSQVDTRALSVEWVDRAQEEGRPPPKQMDIRKFFAAKAGPTKAPMPAKKKLKVGSTSVRSAPRKTATGALSKTSSTRRQAAKVSVAKSPVRQPVASADLQDEEGLSDYEKVINTSSAAPLLSLRNIGRSLVC